MTLFVLGVLVGIVACWLTRTLVENWWLIRWKLRGKPLPPTYDPREWGPR